MRRGGVHKVVQATETDGKQYDDKKQGGES